MEDDMTNCASDPRPFSAVLRAWIDQHGWSDAEAARRLRVPYGTMREWVSAVAPNSRGPKKGTKSGDEALPPRRTPKLEESLRLLMDFISEELKGDPKRAAERS